jgi:structural maintenance of chromosome 3 (chondroitin sulfate proteoglycan 6)
LPRIEDFTEAVRQDDDEANDAEDSQQRTVDNYTGVAIKVRIDDRLQRLKCVLCDREGFFQLESRRGSTYTATFWRSKVSSCLGTWRVFALIATLRHLTLFSVFAIQKCDPAPFYLFDEVRRCQVCCQRCIQCRLV